MRHFVLAATAAISLGVYAFAQPPATGNPGPPASPAANAKSFETGVAAYVNRDIITRAEVWKQLRSSIAGMPEEKRQAAFEGRLLDMIQQRVLAQGTERLQLMISDLALKSAIEEEKERAGGERQFQESLKERGLTEQDYYAQRRGEFERYVLVQTQTGRMKSLGEGLRAEHVVEPTATEVREFYAAHLEDMFSQKAEVKLRVIVLARTQQGTIEKALETAQTIKQELATGADFATLARTHSAVDADKGGDQGWHGSDSSLAQEIMKYALEAPVNQVSEPIPFPATSPVPRGYYLVLVEDRKEARTVPFDEAQIQIRKALRELNIGRAEVAVELKLLREAYIMPPRYKAFLIAEKEKQLQGAKR